MEKHDFKAFPELLKLQIGTQFMSSGLKGKSL